MRKNRVIEQNRCYHLVSRLAHRAFFLDDEEKDRAVALMRRVEAGVQVIAPAMKGFDCNREGHACRVRFCRSRQARPSQRINPICRRFYSMSYCINRAVSISSDPFDPTVLLKHMQVKRWTVSA